MATGKELALKFMGLMQIFTLILNLCTTISTALVKWVSLLEKIRYRTHTGLSSLKVGAYLIVTGSFSPGTLVAFTTFLGVM